MDTVFVTRQIPQRGLDVLKEKVNLRVWQSELPPEREQLLRAVQDVQGLLCLLTDQIDAGVISSAGQLRVISNYAVGFDNIDVAEATRRGIPVGNTPGILTDTTADFAFSLLCAAARRVVEAGAYVRAGKWKTWEPRLMLGTDLWGATAGIVGCGRIGQAVAKRCLAFGMKVLYFDPHENLQNLPEELQRVGLDTLLREADFVSLHTPLTSETHHLFNKERLAMMKPAAVLINTARGAVVDTDALYRVLSEGGIAAAALDVTDPEPLPADHPLLTLPNVIVTPHIASASVATRSRMAVMAAENILAGLGAETLPYCVNPQVYRNGAA